MYGFSINEISKYFIVNSVKNPLTYAFAIFAAGSFAKLLGAVIFGRMADIKGRSLVLKINMLGIALPTFLIGCLPGADSIGIGAALCLFGCRFLQGLLVGVEYDNVTVYVYEKMENQKRPCFTNSWVCLSAGIGIGLAALMTWAAGFINYPNAWRFPFLLGGLLGITVLLLRQKLTETYAFLKQAKRYPTRPLLETIRDNKKRLLVTILICGAVGGTYQFYFVYWLLNDKNLLIFSLTLYLFMLLPAGWLADNLNKSKVLVLSSCILSIIALFIMQGLYSNHLNNGWFMILSLLMPFFHVPASVYLIEKFKVTERCQILSLGHAIGSATFSGTIPLFSYYLSRKTGLPFMPWIIFLILMGVSLIAILLLRNKNEAKPLINPSSFPAL
ncbi:MAG: proP5 [Francisellaceae bacterium]|nr:proP5 [Francisellaceae bacterium]